MSDEQSRVRRPVIAFAAVLVVAAVFLLLVGQATETIENGAQAPDFDLARADGQGRVSLESLRGRLVLLDFWSSSCPPCVRQGRELESIHGRYGRRGLVVVGINTEGAPASIVGGLARQWGIRYTILLDDGEVADRYRATALPTLYLIDREGLVRWSATGFVSRRSLERVIDPHL